MFQYFIEDSVDSRVAELRGVSLAAVGFQQESTHANLSSRPPRKFLQRQNSSLFLKSGALDSARESQINQADLAGGALGNGKAKAIRGKSTKNKSAEESIDDEVS